MGDPQRSAHPIRIGNVPDELHRAVCRIEREHKIWSTWWWLYYYEAYRGLGRFEHRRGTEGRLLCWHGVVRQRGAGWWWVVKARCLSVRPPLHLVDLRFDRREGGKRVVVAVWTGIDELEVEDRSQPIGESTCRLSGCVNMLEASYTSRTIIRLAGVCASGGWGNIEIVTLNSQTSLHHPPLAAAPLILLLWSSRPRWLQSVGALLRGDAAIQNSPRELLHHLVHIDALLG